MNASAAGEQSALPVPRRRPTRAGAPSASGNVPGSTGRHLPSRQKSQSAAPQKPLVGPGRLPISVSPGCRAARPFSPRPAVPTAWRWLPGSPGPRGWPSRPSSTGTPGWADPRPCARGGACMRPGCPTCWGTARRPASPHCASRPAPPDALPHTRCPPSAASATNQSLALICGAPKPAAGRPTAPTA